jgi:hypothetical protein
LDYHCGFAHWIDKVVYLFVAGGMVTGFLKKLFILWSSDGYAALFRSDVVTCDRVVTVVPQCNGDDDEVLKRGFCAWMRI